MSNEPFVADAIELYDLVSDLPRMGEWSPENTGGKWVNGAAGPVVGARFKGSNKSGVGAGGAPTWS